MFCFSRKNLVLMYKYFSDSESREKLGGGHMKALECVHLLRVCEAFSVVGGPPPNFIVN